MTLDEFIASDLRSQWVIETGFDGLYVRQGPYFFDGECADNALQIANVTASKPGAGAFTKLIRKLRLVWQGPIVVESVLNDRFANSLLRLGFRRCSVIEQNYYLKEVMPMLAR